MVRFSVRAAVVCAGYGSGVFEAVQEARLGVVGPMACEQDDGRVEDDGGRDQCAREQDGYGLAHGSPCAAIVAGALNERL